MRKYKEETKLVSIKEHNTSAAYNFYVEFNYINENKDIEEDFMISLDIFDVMEITDKEYVDKKDVIEVAEELAFSFTCNIENVEDFRETCRKSMDRYYNFSKYAVSYQI